MGTQETRPPLFLRRSTRRERVPSLTQVKPLTKNWEEAKGATQILGTNFVYIKCAQQVGPDIPHGGSVLIDTNIQRKWPDPSHVGTLAQGERSMRTSPGLVLELVPDIPPSMRFEAGGRRRYVQQQISMPPRSLFEVGETSTQSRNEVGPYVRPQISMPPPTDKEAAHDDIIIISARKFEEAKARRISRTVSEQEGSSKRVIDNAQGVTLTPPLRKKPAFICPICMDPIVNAMSTLCGHIFCKDCIRQSVGAQGKCAVCRRSVTIKDCFRIYLPTVN